MLRLLHNELTEISKSRREKVIEDMQNKISLLEKILIDTPEEMGSEEYERLIEEVREARKTLEILKGI